MRRITDTLGWKSGWGWRSDLWTAPDGTQYAQCRNGERADVELVPSMQPLPSIFLREYDTSAKKRREQKEARQLERAARAKRRKVRSKL